MHDDHADVHGEVEEGEEEVLPLSELLGVVSSHDEGHKSNPLEGEGAKSSHGHSTSESSSSQGTVSSDSNDPRDGERHPGGGKHVDHGGVVLVEVVLSVSEDHVQDDGDNNEEVGDDTVDHHGSEGMLLLLNAHNINK